MDDNDTVLARPERGCKTHLPEDVSIDSVGVEKLNFVTELNINFGAFGRYCPMT